MTKYVIRVNQNQFVLMPKRVNSNPEPQNKNPAIVKDTSDVSKSYVDSFLMSEHAVLGKCHRYTKESRSIFIKIIMSSKFSIANYILIKRYNFINKI